MSLKMFLSQMETNGKKFVVDLEIKKIPFKMLILIE